MKKVLSIALVAGMFAIYSCGPSAEEKAAAEKHKADSVQKAMDDSMAMVKAAADAAMAKAAADSAAMAAAEKAKADSMAAASKAKPAGKKKK